jgi:flagellar motor switch protein FliG
MVSPRTSLRNAAVVLSSLPRQQAAELLGRLDPRQAAAVTAEMGQLGGIDGAEQQKVAREFAGASAAQRDERQPAPTAPFQFLHDLDGDILLDLLAEERPQTVAMVLACLPPRQAAAALAELTPEEQLAVVCRMATMSETSEEIVADVEQGLRRRLRSANESPADNPGVASVVRMFNAMEPAVERRLLDAMAAAAPQLVLEIRQAMFGPDVAACDEWNAMEAAG